MKLVVQRVLSANLKVDGKVVSKIDNGLVVFVGVNSGDGDEQVKYFTKKIPDLRIFEDENGRTNKSILDVKGEILLVSQFTLCANTSHGNRPDFFGAEKPERANQVYLALKDGILNRGVPVYTGVFGADMKIEQVNDGPFTIVMEK
jgi:D-tyrosyl-tRNA(Tyr) deacylase